MLPKGRGRRKPEPAAKDDVVFMTAPLFAIGTKNPLNTAYVQEQLLHDQLTLIRHGERQDHVDKAWKGNGLLPLSDPPLSSTGRKQSFETALKYFTLLQEKTVEQRIQGTFSAILVSPFHRCLETALILNIVAFEGSLAMFVDPQLSDWQQQKVFRVAPTLGGCYTFAEEGTRPRKASSKSGDMETKANNGGSLVFKPQHEALRVALEPFFQTRAGELDTIAETHKVTADVAAAWSTHLDVWLANHESLPVWTSAATEAAIVAQLTRREEEPQKQFQQQGATTSGGGRNGNHPDSSSTSSGQKAPKGGWPSGKTTPGPSECADATRYAQCGVPHPEGKADLQRRCQQVEQTHFLRSEASLQQIPTLVQAAMAKEQKERLPKYFQVYDARPEASRQRAGPPALLPPMRVMIITHADVVSGIVDACCPKHLGDASGKSVPYCSVTVLTRHNNYYRIPPPEERLAQAGGGGGGSSPKGKGRGRGSGGGGGKNQNQQATVTAPTRGGASPLESFPVGWQVEVVGSTDLLVTTRVVLQFN